MLSRVGSPVNGSASGCAGVKDERIEPKIFFVLVPSSEGIIGRDASSTVLPAPSALLPPLAPPPFAAPGLSSSSGRSARICSSTELVPLRRAFSAAIYSLRRLTSGSFGHAVVLAVISSSLSGGGRFRLGGTTSGARSR